MCISSCQHFPIRLGLISPSALCCPHKWGHMCGSGLACTTPSLVVTATAETSTFQGQVPSPCLWWLQGPLLILVTFACLFSGVLGTLGKRDRGVMKGNRLPVPILFSLL